MTLTNPRTSAAYDQSADRVVLTLFDPRSAVSAVVELDPDSVPALINGLMSARHTAKGEQARKPAPAPSPAGPKAADPGRPERSTFHMAIPRITGPDAVPIRRIAREETARMGTRATAPSSEVR